MSESVEEALVEEPEIDLKIERNLSKYSVVDESTVKGKVLYDTLVKMAERLAKKYKADGIHEIFRQSVVRKEDQTFLNGVVQNIGSKLNYHLSFASLASLQPAK